MRYSEEIVSEVMSRNDIVDVISEYVGLKKAGREYKCCCPFHNEKTPSFSVNRDKQMFHCFGCGVGGNVYTFVMKYTNKSFPEAVESLAERAGMELPHAELTEAEKQAISKREKLLDINRQALIYFNYLLTQTERGKLGLKYYKETRQFTDETIAAFGLGYADLYRDDLYRFLKSRGYSDDLMREAGLVNFDEKYGPHDKFWNRVMVPIFDMNGKCIAFGGRVLGDAKPKYLNTMETPVFNKSKNLFAYNIARRSRRRGVILCEGYMDVITQHQFGFDNAMASLGTAFTPQQASLIKRHTDEVYLAYDSDEAGTKAAMRAIQILRDLDMSQRIISLKPYKDPDEFLKNEGPEKYEERIKEAIPGRLFEVDQISHNYSVDDPEEKTHFMQETGRILAGISDSTERNNYIESVARRYFLDATELKKIVSRIGMAGLEERRYVADDEVVDNRPRESTRKKLNPDRELEKYLLTFLINEEELFDKLADVVTEADFTEDTIKDVASYVFNEYRTNHHVNPAAILNRFEDPDEQEEVSSMFTKTMEFEMGPTEKKKALQDVILRVKMKNIEKLQREGKGSQIELARKKNALKNLQINI